jgi:hypothetical protein
VILGDEPMGWPSMWFVKHPRVEDSEVIDGEAAPARVETSGVFVC